MAESVVATYQHSQPGSSRKVLSRIERSISPKSERYRIKQILLQEKFDIIEAQTDALRKRVQVVKKEVQRAMEVRRALCSLLDEKGDRWYKGCIEMDMNDKYDFNPLHDFADLLRREETGGRKRSRPSGKSKPKVVKAKEQPMTTEQKQEEERAKAKIVSIIDSVFSETAKKTAKNKQIVNNKFSMKNGASRNTQPYAQVARQPIAARTKASAGVSKVSQTRTKNNVHHSRRALPYKVFSNKNQRKTISTDTVNGVHEGIKFTYISRANGHSKKRSEKKAATLQSVAPAETPMVLVIPPEDEAKAVVNQSSVNQQVAEEAVPKIDGSLADEEPVADEASNDQSKPNEEPPTSKESSATPVESESTAVEPENPIATSAEAS